MEAKPEEPPGSAPDGARKSVSILMLATRWQFDTYGLSTVNKSLVNNMRLVDPDAQTLKITCAVLDEEGKIAEGDQRDAEKHGVTLKGAKQPRGKKRKCEMSWLNEQSVLYYSHLVFKTKFDFILGHIPYLADGSFNLRDLSRELHQGDSPKVILVAHTLPLTNEGDVDEETLIDWLLESDLILSVGHNIHLKMDAQINTMEHPDKICHRLYLPGFPIEFFTVERRQDVNELKGEQSIVVMTTERDNLSLSGIDLELAVKTSALASQYIMFHEGSNLSKQISFNFKLIADKKDDKISWEEDLKVIKEKAQLDGRTPTLRVQVPADNSKLIPHLKRATILILPLKPESSLFGTEALVAIAAGVPILVSRNSGIASYLHSKSLSEPIVWDHEGTAKDVETWKERLIQKIVNPHEASGTTKELRKMLLLDTNIASTHLSFIQTVAESLCIQLRLDLEGADVSPEGIEAALQFGVQIHHEDKSVDAKTYVVAFFRKLLLQREKINRGLLVEELKPSIAQLWQEVLSTLEERRRKVLEIQSGSIVFTLFCPTKESMKQLQEELWARTLTTKLEDLLQSLGITPKIRVQTQEVDVIGHETPTLPLLPQLKRLQTKTSESEDPSEGYETMTTTGSDMSEDLPGQRKVKAWLLLQQQQGSSDSDVQSMKEPEMMMTLVKSWDLEHIQYIYDFTVSESETIAIASQPSLSVIYPVTDKAPFILSADKSYACVIFFRISGQREKLAATCTNDSSIHVWDSPGSRDFRVVYRLKSGRRKLMNLCLIDEGTVGYGEVDAPGDGSCKVYILNTDTEKEWILSSTICLTTGVKSIYDMCYVKTLDGTSCLVLCCPYDGYVQAVEMIGGNIRWKTREEQLGAKFYPWSICIDGSTNLCVADPLQGKLHFLSIEDGAAIKSLSLKHCGIGFPLYVRAQNDFIYVGHEDRKRKKLHISQLRNTEDA